MQWLLKNYGLAVQLHTHLIDARGTDGPGYGYALAPLAKLSHKRVPMDSTFLWKLAYYLHLLRKETWNARVDHLETLLFERKPNKRRFGGHQQ